MIHFKYVVIMILKVAISSVIMLQCLAMHPRNLHKNPYNFDALVESLPMLAQYVIYNPGGQKTINFANPAGVKTLNAALLKHFYNVDFWDIPEGFLCPPVPGRADYIHAIADLIAKHLDTKNKQVVGLDIGTGANLIYPIIGSQSYGWKFVASDIDKNAIKSAQLIQSSNAALKNSIKIRHQKHSGMIFDSVIEPTEKFTFSMCNPPFHTSKQAAAMGSVQKNANLKRHQNKRNPKASLPKKTASTAKKLLLNFAGQSNELWCDGGEVGFIQRMMVESVNYKNQIEWFTSLVSKKDSLKPLRKKLSEIGVKNSSVISMQQGSKISRLIAWRF